MTPLPVLLVAADDHALRMLDVTLRLGGFTSLPRASVADAARARPGDDPPLAVVIDLGGADDGVEPVRGLVEQLAVPVVVILPAGAESERARYESAGARVLHQPYAPADLYAAVSPGTRS